MSRGSPSTKRSCAASAASSTSASWTTGGRVSEKASARTDWKRRASEWFASTCRPGAVDDQRPREVLGEARERVATVGRGREIGERVEHHPPGLLGDGERGLALRALHSHREEVALVAGLHRDGRGEAVGVGRLRRPDGDAPLLALREPRRSPARARGRPCGRSRAAGRAPRRGRATARAAARNWAVVTSCPRWRAWKSFMKAKNAWFPERRRSWWRAKAPLTRGTRAGA